MAGSPEAAPWPTELRLRPGGTKLAVSFDDGATAELSAETLRRMTPSAADRGHGGPSDQPLDIDASKVRITALAPVGRYAVRLSFDDGHDTGLYTWPLLHKLVSRA